MNDIYIFRDGQTIPAKIEQLFVTHGPYTIEGKRLDLLTKAQIIVDSSTSSISQVGTSSSTANTGSMLGRAVVGGVLTGGAGAVIGGLSGKRDSTINTVSSESKNTELTTELTFDDGSSLYVLIKSMKSFHWLLGFASQRAWSEGEIETFRNQASNKKFEMELYDAHEEAIKKIGYPRHGNKDVIKKAESDILNTTFEILKNTTDTVKTLDYDEFLVSYRNNYPERIIDSNNNTIDYSDKYKFSTIFFLAVSVLSLLILIYSISSSYISSDDQKDKVVEESPLEYFNKNSTQIINQVKEYIESGNLKEAEALSSKYLTTRNQDIINLNIKVKYKLAAVKKTNSVVLTETNTTSINNKNTSELGVFGLFNEEAEIVKNRLGCPNSVDSDITPPLDGETGALYGCIKGKMETVKWFINETPNSNHVSSVKFLWNDWFKDIGYGLHSDKQEAKKALKLLIELYVPEKESELNKIFFGNKSITINSSKFTIQYTYDHGPAIDERMIVVTANKATQNILSPPTEIKSAPEPVKNITGLQWQYTQAEDKMIGGTSYHATVLSTNTVNFGFPYNGLQNATLHLRSSPKSGKNLLFSLEKGQILCNSYDGCSILVRFDNEKATTYSATAAADNSTEIIFIDNYSKFVEKMMKAKRVLISTNIYQQGAPVFEFDISDFDKDQYKPKK